MKYNNLYYPITLEVLDAIMICHWGEHSGLGTVGLKPPVRGVTSHMGCERGEEEWFWKQCHLHSLSLFLSTSYFLSPTLM